MQSNVTAPDPATSDTDENFSEMTEEVSYNFRELIDMLYEKRDLIITVPTDQVEALKKGLYSRKGKDTQKLSSAGVVADKEVLSFLVYHPKDENKKDIKEQSCVRVKLAPRKGVTVLNIEVPDDEF